MTTNFNFQNENKFDAIVIGSGMSGGIQANINRWRGQISLPPESIESILKASSSFNSKLGDFLFFELVISKLPCW